MRTKIVAVILAMSAGAAMALPVMDYEVSSDGQAWGKSLTAHAGDIVKVRASVVWTDVTAYGLAAVFHKIRISGATADDSTDITLINQSGTPNFGRVAPFAFGAAQAGTSLIGSTRLYFAQGSGGTEGYYSSAQRAPVILSGPNPDFSTANPALIIQFQYTIGNTTNRQLSFDSLLANQAQGGSGQEFYFYTSSTSVSSGLRTTGSVDAAFVNVIVPSPAGLALIGLGGLAVTRRRR